MGALRRAAGRPSLRLRISRTERRTAISSSQSRQQICPSARFRCVRRLPKPPGSCAIFRNRATTVFALSEGFLASVGRCEVALVVQATWSCSPRRAAPVGASGSGGRCSVARGSNEKGLRLVPASATLERGRAPREWVRSKELALLCLANQKSRPGDVRGRRYGRSNIAVPFRCGFGKTLQVQIAPLKKGVANFDGRAPPGVRGALSEKQV